ncbi:hypothetical protein AB0O95_10635 [Rhodoglobus sp. NPDC076762]
MSKRSTFRSSLGCAALALVTVGVTGCTAAAEPPEPSNGEPGWTLVHQEDFSGGLDVNGAAWQVDPYGEESPWNVDHLDDDGRFYEVQAGEDLERHLSSFDLLRKQVTFGDDDWLTVQMATRDTDGDGVPDSEPSLTAASDDDGSYAELSSPTNDGGIIVTNTEPLPAEYRIEYTLRTVDFGGKRDGSFEYDGKTNGYATEGCKSNYPWIRSGDYSGDAEPCSDAFGDVRAENGFYLLSIMDYDDPAPHNNVFIHNHRKVGMDTYSVNAAWSSGYKVCNPETGEIAGYDEGNANGINQIFFDGSRFRDASIGYNQFIMPTECGVRDGATKGESIVATAELQPELMPDETYNFAIERSATGYVTEMTGNFRHVGETTLRYERDFVEDGTPIWHFNQTADEYNGEFDQTLTFDGPFGSYDVEQWPEGSAYPDHFIIGDPHLNYYEGSASFTNIRLFVPADAE